LSIEKIIKVIKPEHKTAKKTDNGIVITEFIEKMVNWTWDKWATAGRP
jgi:hypothetical protein